MKHFCLPAATAFAILSAPAAHAVDQTLSSGGFTGYGVTPNAHLLGWGQFGFSYDRQIPGAADPSGHNFVAGFGLLPNMEASLRLGTNTLRQNCFADPCAGQIRDASASAKVGIGLDAANRFRIALGAADVGGAATNFRSYYGVLTWSGENTEFSGGLARRSDKPSSSRTPLHGVFASAAWQPLPWVRGHLEYADRDAWAGVRLFAPREWLPEGWSAHIGANTRLTSSNVTERAWLSAGITIPLYKVPSRSSERTQLPELAGTQQRMPAYEARVPALPAAPNTAAVPALPATDAMLEELARALQAAGLEDISVGRLPDGAIALRANNATYNWNTVDALGAMLGATARTLAPTRSSYRAVLTQRQVPIVAVRGQAECLQQWIATPGSTCAGGELSTPGTMSLDDLHAGVAWQLRDVQPSWKTLRVQLSPVLRTSIGTEIGAFDYSLGANVGFLQPLWAGASAEWRVQAEVAHSDNYANDGAFARRRVLDGTERLVFTQTLPLPLALWFGTSDPGTARALGGATAQASIGRIGGHFDGVHGALRWEPGDGRHRFSAEGGWFHNSRFGYVPGQPRRATPALLAYRYNVAPTRTYLEATGGQFMNSDRGLQLGLRQWFGDVAVQFYLRRTRFANSGTRNMAGIEFSVPIGPRRDMQPSLFQVTGTPRFSHAVETVVRGGSNPVLSGVGVIPPAPSLNAVYNSDRASLLYFEDNLPRLRDAAR